MVVKIACVFIMIAMFVFRVKNSFFLEIEHMKRKEKNTFLKDFWPFLGMHLIFVAISFLVVYSFLSFVSIAPFFHLKEVGQNLYEKGFVLSTIFYIVFCIVEGRD